MGSCSSCVKVPRPDDLLRGDIEVIWAINDLGRLIAKYFLLVRPDPRRGKTRNRNFRIGAPLGHTLYGGSLLVTPARPPARSFVQWPTPRLPLALRFLFDSNGVLNLSLQIDTAKHFFFLFSQPNIT